MPGPSVAALAVAVVLIAYVVAAYIKRLCPDGQGHESQRQRCYELFHKKKAEWDVSIEKRKMKKT